MLKRPSVLPKSQKTTFYAVFTFVSDVSTFLLVKSGKTACHGRFRSRPVPPPLCPDLDLRGGHLPLYLCACRLPRRRLLPFSACPGSAASSRSPPSSPGRSRRLLPVASFLHYSTAPAPRPVASQERDVVARERRSPRRKLPQAPQARTGAGSGTGTRLPGPP